jgi:hypothetical protein
MASPGLMINAFLYGIICLRTTLHMSMRRSPHVRVLIVFTLSQGHHTIPNLDPLSIRSATSPSRSSSKLSLIVTLQSVVGQLYSIQYKSIFGAPDKVRRNTCEEARPSRLDFQRDEVVLDIKTYPTIVLTEDCMSWCRTEHSYLEDNISHTVLDIKIIQT